MPNRYEEALKRAGDIFLRMAEEAQREGIIPYKCEKGRIIGSPFDGNSWWTGGFWPGLMWQLYAQRKEERYLEEARRVEALLTQELRSFTYLNHDVGFMYLLSCGADYKLTGDQQARTDALHAASLLMGRFNPVGFIRAWNAPHQVGMAIIDCMMNLSLLFWASRETGDPRFASVARIHADTTLREFMRPDGSVSHIIEFDPASGRRVREHAGQGYALGSSWSRGQAWGLYGFTLAFMNTGEKKYLEAAERIADYFALHIRKDGLTDSDFCQPSGEERIDNLAGAIASCGYMELAGAAGKEEYRKTGLRLLDGLLDHCCDFGEGPGILTHCTASYNDDGAGRHTNITYGDYFLVEALEKVAGNDPMLWR